MPVQMPVQTLILDLAVRYGFQVLGAMVILLAGFMVGRWIAAAVDKRLERQRMEPPMRMRGIAAPVPRHDVRLLDGVGVGAR